MPRSWCAESSGQNTAHSYDKDPVTLLNNAYHDGPLNSLADMVLHYPKSAYSRGLHDKSPHLNRWGLF